MIRKMNPNRAKNAVVTDRLAAVNRAFLNRRTSSIGWARRRSTNANTMRIAMPPINPARIHGEVQPHVGASMIAQMTKPTPAAESTSPRKSMGPMFGSRDSGSKNAPSTIAMMATGMLTMKMDPQEKCSRSRPPVMGPIATATPTIAVQMPMAAARSLGSVNTLTRIARVAGKMSAAPIPIKARAPMSWPDVVESAASPDVMANTTSPSCNARLRPMRSPKWPIVSRRAENTRV